MGREMVRRFNPVAVAALAIAIGGSNASAVASQSREVGAYTIYEASHSCTAGTTINLPGRAPTKIHWVYFGGEHSSAHLLLESTDWSAVQGQQYEGFVFQFTNPNTYVQGLPAQGVDGGGFKVELPIQALDAFAVAQRFTVARGAEPESAAIILDMNLVGSGAAIRALKQCADNVFQRNAATDRAEASFSHIARDPFASDPPAPKARAWVVRPMPDFPDMALQGGIERARVELSCDVTETGALAQCSVTNEAPEGHGFGAAALRSLGRARVSPGDTSRFNFSLVFNMGNL